MYRFTSAHNERPAHNITIEGVDDGASTKSLLTALVRPNLYQVDASVSSLRLFARRRAIRAKEVTVAMTIDASLVLGQGREVSAGRSAPCADVVLGGWSGT
ncbi:hypothetical protein LB518_24255 [Mesorhizobium sp. BR1-1-16]|uniref:hypothetical protein n=1 Tax=Mesorhizobium sp. BR1-1-16 TaxID=2876653 RepID=UPI001CC96A52|nr:hypothetical protein [Mesorhizobium sp. BR1-1-16]MBZ9939423.1 hypothetical protein [Mesorhizobium sp. BR1-1-16]